MIQLIQRFFSLNENPCCRLVETDGHYFCVFPGNNRQEMMIYIGEEGIFSYENLTGDFTSLHRQKAIEVKLEGDELQLFKWMPGRFPEPLEKCDFLPLIFEALIKDSQPQQQSAIAGTPPLYRYNNDLKIHRLKKLPRKAVVWETVQFLFAPKVWDHELECELLQVGTLMTDGLDLVFQRVSVYKEENLSQIGEKLGENLLERGYLPEKIVVEDGYAQGMLQSFCRQAGICCEIGPIPNARAFRDDLMGVKPEADPLQEAISYLETLSKQVYGQMLACQSFSELERRALPELLSLTFMYMGVQCHQFPPTWSCHSIKEMLASNYLEENMPEPYKECACSLILKFLNFANDIGLLDNAKELSETVQPFCRTKIF